MHFNVDLAANSFCVWRFFLFFFQAEDGIGDDLVTGVQTCALPISAARRRARLAADRRLRARPREAWRGRRRSARGRREARAVTPGFFDARAEGLEGVETDFVVVGSGAGDRKSVV